MKIELVGGPLCGEIVPMTPDLMPRVALWDWQGGAVTYARRDGGTTICPMYGRAGVRMYEYVRPGVPA